MRKQRLRKREFKVTHLVIGRTRTRNNNTYFLYRRALLEFIYV
jgi:hypothetical protein